MKNLMLLFFLSTFLAACSSRLTFDPSLVRPWSNDLARNEPSHPRIIVFKKRLYELIYLAAHHSVELSSDTLKLVKHLFETKQPKVTLLEPFSYSYGKSPQFYIDYAQKGLKGNFIEGGESSYAAILASENGIPFFGGEPTHKEVFDSLLKEGFSKEDVIGFYLARQVPQWIRQNRLKTENIESVATGYLKLVCKDFELSTKDCFSFSKFKLWYEHKNKKKFKITIDANEVAPYNDGQYFTQKISSSVGNIRDHYIVKIIEKLLQEYKTVLVIYGGSHFLTQEKVFEQALGEAILSDQIHK